MRKNISHYSVSHLILLFFCVGGGVVLRGVIGISGAVSAQTTAQVSTQPSTQPSAQPGGGVGMPDTTNQQIKSTVRAVEQRDDIENKTIYTNVSHGRIMSLLERGCSQQSIEKAQDFVQAAQQILSRKYSGQSQAEILLDTYEVYNLVNNLNLNQVNQRSGDGFCTLKYAMNGLMRFTREENLAIVRSSGIINDFNGGDGQLHGSSIKIDTLRNYNAEYFLAKQQVGTPFSVTIDNPEFLTGLGTDKQIILQATQELMENIIADTLISLKQAGLFAQNDLDIIARNITFEYKSECNRFNGRYDVVQTVDHLGTLVGTETTGINFIINYCPNYFVIRDMPEIFSKIVTHELAHHFYYYHDDAVEDFETICWSDFSERNERCTAQDFVSDYAQTASVEDYAEHFMYRYLDLPISENTILNEKTNYFQQFAQ